MARRLCLYRLRSGDQLDRATEPNRLAFPVSIR